MIIKMNRKQIKKRNLWVAFVFACYVGAGMGCSLVEILGIVLATYWLFLGILYYAYARKSLFSKSKKKDVIEEGG
jgi:hypothetical protein